MKALTLAAAVSMMVSPAGAAEPQRLQMTVGAHRFTVVLDDTPGGQGAGRRWCR